MKILRRPWLPDCPLSPIDGSAFWQVDAWLVLAALSLGLIFYRLRASPPPAGSSLIPPVLGLILIVELFWAAQSLSYNQPTAPQAFHSSRNAPTFLLAANPPNDPTEPPDRFLSLSGITYDPGDLRELEQIFGDSLSPKAFYNLIVAAKEKEVLFFMRFIFCSSS